MFTLSQVEVDSEVAAQVVALFQQLDRGRGGPMGTWHGQRLRDNPYPWFQSTFDRVTAALSHLRIDEWWFNCGQAGDEYRWHEHVPYPWAAVLYVQTPENSGGIEFRRQEEYAAFQPVAGDFLLFSGNLAHRVLPNKSADYRISVAFNLTSRSK